MTETFLKNFLNDTLKEIMAVLRAECGSLFLFDPEHKELILDSFYNAFNLNIKGIKKRVGEGVAGKVIDLKRPILVKDIDRDLRFHCNGFKHYHTKSFISIPLVLPSEESIIGLVNIADKANGQAFTKKDFKFAVTLCKYACTMAEYLRRFSQLRKDKEELNKYASVGKLAAGVVHEINNPLDGVIRYTNILIDQVHLEDNSVTRQYLMEVKKGLNRIANITRDLLGFSHVVSSFPIQQKKYVDIHKLIDESLDLMNHRINGNIKIEKKYVAEMPKIIDFGLQHVMINLIKNAIDAMPEGGRLEVSAEMKDSIVEICFKDTGFGIPSDIQERIFEPFFTTKSIDKGTGLGLSICKEIIHKYGGDIKVNSSPGSGSAFTILLPQRHLENATSTH